MMETTVYIKYEAVQKLDVWIAQTTRVVSHFHVYWTMQLGWRYKNFLFQEYLETGNMKTNFPLHRSQETLQQACHALCLSVPHLACTNSNLMSIHQRRLHCVPASWIRRIFAQRSQQCETISSSLISYFICFQIHLIIPSLVHSASFSDGRYCPKQKHNRRLKHLETRKIESYFADIAKNASVWTSTQSVKSEDCHHMCFLWKKRLINIMKS